LTAVKICGLTRPEDVALACRLGAEWVGFNFAAESPRRVALAKARALADAAAPGVLRVGVFVSETASEIAEAAEAARLDLVQLHRILREEDVAAVPRPIVAVARVSTVGTGIPAPRLLAQCRALLLDTWVDGRAGGTGRAFDWSLVPSAPGLPVLLAGGLSAENVGEAVRTVRPWGVDVSSGVESAPGVKDAREMERFFEAVRRADADAA
jgi:phosphoribosylanthranilate isomerase